MADDYLNFLKNKFVIDFQEAVEAVEEWEEFPAHQKKEGWGGFPMFNDFNEILNLLQTKTIWTSELISQLKTRLWDLNELLADSLMIAERRRQIKGVVLPTRSAKELWDRIRARQKLIVIKKTLEKCKDVEATKSEISSSILVLEPEAFHYYDKSKIHGLESQMQEIENRILSKTKDRKAIAAIVGMCGSGKTALARSVFCSPNVKNHFAHRLWIDLSEATDAEKEYFCILVENFGGGYKKSACQYGLDEVLDPLYGHLHGGMCLIVLDGLWHANKGIQDFIRVILSLKGAVIVTSRLLDVANLLVADHGYLHSIQPLDPKHCWSVFMDTIDKKSLADVNFALEPKMVEEILNRCDGLPLAAKTLAEIMSTVEWRNSVSPWQYATDQSKKMIFEINVHDRVSLGKAWFKVTGLPGVNVERTLYYKNRFQVTGTCTPDDIAIELGRFCHVELISIAKL